MAENKTSVSLLSDGVQNDFKKGDKGYVDGYVQAADGRPYAVVVRYSDGYMELVPAYSLKAFISKK